MPTRLSTIHHPTHPPIRPPSPTPGRTLPGESEWVPALPPSRGSVGSCPASMFVDKNSTPLVIYRQVAGVSCRPGPGPCSYQCPSLRACAQYLAALPARAPVPLTCVSQFSFQRVPECQPVCSCLLWEVCSSQGPSLAGGGGGGCRQLLRGMLAAGGQSEAGVRLHLLHLSITYTHR